MKQIVISLLTCLVGIAVSADALPWGMKYFANGITEVEYDLTNDCIVVRYNPAAKMFTYVSTKSPLDDTKLQPGEKFAISRGVRARFSQRVGAGCTVAFTNGVSDIDGVSLPTRFKGAEWQLLIDGVIVSGRDRTERERYRFVVNADGEAYDVMERREFHFGIPFHAPEDKSPPKPNKSIVNMQDSLRKEGLAVYRRAWDEPAVKVIADSVKEGVTIAVPFVWKTGGVGNVCEKDIGHFLENDPEFARLYGSLEANRKQHNCVAFCTREHGLVRLTAVTRISDGTRCRLWCYEKAEGLTFVYDYDRRKAYTGCYQFGNDGLLRNFYLAQQDMVDFWTVEDGELQQSAELKYAQTFKDMVEDLFKRYAALDTTGTLKTFDDSVPANNGSK